VTIRHTPIALLLGLIISLLLFWLMQYMILHNPGAFKSTSDLKMVEFVRLKRDQQRLQTKERIPKKPPPKEKPPPPKMETQPVQQVQATTPQVKMPNIDVPKTARKLTGSVLTGMSKAPIAKSKGVVTKKAVVAPKGPVVRKAPVAKKAVKRGPVRASANIRPISTVPPKYPKRAQKRRIEGWVKVQFIITVTGRVKNPRVIGSSPSDIFNSAALKSIARWKFKPKVIKGQPVEQIAVQKLQFKLSSKRRR